MATQPDRKPPPVNPTVRTRRPTHLRWGRACCETVISIRHQVYRYKARTYDEDVYLLYTSAQYSYRRERRYLSCLRKRPSRVSVPFFASDAPSAGAAAGCMAVAATGAGRDAEAVAA